APAGRIVPVLALPRALHRNTDIGLGDGPAAIDECDLRRHLGRVDAEDVTCRAVDSNLAEIAGDVVLMVDDYALLVEVHRNRVRRVIVLGLDLLEWQESDVRIRRAEQRDQRLADRAGEPAAVALLELRRIRKPAERIAERL